MSGESINWQKTWSKRFSIRLGENWICSVNQFNHYFGVAFPDQAILIEEGMGKGFLDAGQLDACSAHILEQLQKNPFRVHFEKKALPVFRRFLAECKELNSKSISGHSNAQLEKILNNFLKKEDEWMNYVWYVFLLDGIISSKLQALLKRNWSEDYNQITKMVLQSPKRTAAAKYKIELLKAAIILNKNSQSSEKIKLITQKIAKKFCYFPILNMDEAPLRADEVEKQLKEMLKTTADPAKEMNELISSEKKLNNRYKKFIGTVKDRSLRNFIEAAHQVAYYREYRNDLRQMSYFYARKLYSVISHRLDIGLREVTFLTRDEIRSSLKKGKLIIPKEKIQKRIHCSGLINMNQHEKYVFDASQLATLTSELKRFEANSEQADLFNKSGIIRGTVANPGRARGKVKIILNMLTDASKFNKGDILVATTTNLSFIPLMEKAAAIIIDEGGLLTHAAIVSRELGKPCISGTKIATKVLRDGDEVEIAGGIVTIIR